MQTEYLGLTDQEANNKILEYGKNLIPEAKQKNIFQIFVEQFKSPLIYVLIFVSLITLYLKDYSDAIIVLLVVIVNSVVGTVQSVRTNNTVKALKHLSRPYSKVIRSGKLKSIHTENLVPGDIVLLGPGDIAPADGVFVETREISINESSLTGESIPVYKKVAEKVFKGTIVVSGNGIFRVVETGANTVIGKISSEVLDNVGHITELEKKINKLVKYILFVVFSVSIFLIFFGYLNNLSLVVMFKTAVSLAVSVIPEGLPIVLTIVLSVGAWRLTKVKVLLKNLASGGTLATVSYVCTDKTGTLTKGEITLEEIINFNNVPTDDLNKYITASLDIKKINKEKIGDILDLKVSEKIGFVDLGDFTETKELPFISENKYNAKEYKVGEKIVQIYKGAPEIFIQDNSVYEKYVLEGKRVLCIAKKEKNYSDSFSPKDTEILALLVFEDEIRRDVKKAVGDIQNTGVKVILITGDNIQTAKYVANKVGIIKNQQDIFLTGEEFDKLSDGELKKKLAHLKVLARANPDHKVRIVRLLQEIGEVVAMTGDGVNDGPAISKANIGISMGKGGTEVAREASDMVLFDDNFTSIVSGIFEARTIIENIKKTIIFLFGTSLGEIIIIVGTLILGLPIALLPVQILWLNLITDGFLDIAIANEKKEKNYSKQHYTRYRGFILNSYDLLRIVVMGATMGIVSIFAYIYFIKIFALEVARSAMLILMSIFQWLNSFNVRRHYDSIFTFNIFSNLYISFALVIEIVLLYFSIYTEVGQNLLKTSIVGYNYLLLILITSLTIILADELVKFFKRKSI